MASIVAVKNYFDRCKKEVNKEKFSSVQRTTNALDVGVATVKRVMAMYNRNPDLLEKEVSQRGRPPHALSYSIQTIVRNYIHKANRQRRALDHNQYHYGRRMGAWSKVNFRKNTLNSSR